MPQPRRSRAATAPTKEGQQLARRDYAERVIATLGDQRRITDQFLQYQGEFSPNRVSVRDLYNMRLDPMIKMGLYYAKAPLVRSDWSVKCEDPAVAAGMTEIVKKVRQPWMRTALTKLDFGFQATIKSYELGRIDATYEDPDTGEPTPVWADNTVQPVVLGVPVPIPPEYAKVHLIDGAFGGIETTMRPSSSTQDDNVVPPEWSLWFTNEFEETFRNYYGVSRILPAYEPWYAYWFTHHMRSRHIEMDADPALQVWYPPGTYADPGDLDESGQPRIKTNRDAALEIGARLRGGGTIAWPSDVYVDEQGKSTPTPLWRAEFLKGGENLGAFNDVLGDLEIQKLRACLVPEEALVANPKGQSTRASSANYGQIFTESLEMEAMELDQIWNQRQLRAIAEANWGKDCPVVEIQTTGFQEEDMSLAQELVKIAFNLDPNALPLKFEEILDRLNLPQYTPAEQADREKAAAEAQQQAAADQAAAGGDPNAPPGAPPGPPGGAVGPLPGETPASLAASQDDRRSGPRKYEREVIHLSSAPGWAKREGARRDKNVAAIRERLYSVVLERYEEAFNAAADAIADEALSLDLSISDTIMGIVGRVSTAISDRVARLNNRLTGELAGVYHVAGVSELSRLGLSSDSWDVGRDEVQEWARFRAGELIKTIDPTVVEKHVRPWLASELQNLGIQDETGVPYGALELAQRFTEKFANYPEWMAERVVRSEARTGYNLSAADMWERVGVQEVEEYDGLGGRTGKTDEHCLARNGQRVSIEQFRQDNADEHPNGTLGAVPVTVNVALKPLDPGLIVPEPALSASIYAVTDEGLILSEAEVGEALAG